MSDDGAPLWGGRFSSPPAPAAHALGSSIAFDVRLAPHDVAASIAHVRALEDAGVLDGVDADRLASALEEVGAAIVEGRFAFDDADEDVHSAIERGVTDRLGDLGARLHAGRSRNDLVMTDLRSWLREAAGAIDEDCRRLALALVERAREHVATVMPGTTHLRAAQPVTLGHHLCAHAWALTRDRERLAQWSERASVCPLGAGALATSTLGLDAAATARRLGFGRPFENSLDAVSDRDVVQEFLAVAAILATHASRLAADLARWTDPMLGWAELDDAYATGSSMMPQKRNPDSAELVRAKAARIAGDFATVCAVLQGLPLGYHRDLQEDKEPAFDAADTLALVLPALEGAVRTIRFDEAAMRAGVPRRWPVRDRSGGGARPQRRAVPHRPSPDGGAVAASGGRGPEPRRPHRLGVGGVRTPRRRRVPRPGPCRPRSATDAADRHLRPSPSRSPSSSGSSRPTVPRHGAAAARRFRARSSPARTRRAPPARERYR